jgi:hypothetical protein
VHPFLLFHVYLRLLIDGPSQSAYSSHGYTCVQNTGGLNYSYVFIHWPIPSNHNPVIQGVFICILGLGLLVTADVVTDKNYSPLDRGKGDAFMVAGATLYGFSASGCLDVSF